MMTLTKSQKVYVAIMVIGLVALLIDRTMLQPEQAAADAASALQYAISPSTSSAGPEDPGSPRSEGPAPRQVAIARKLEQIAEQRGLDPTGVIDAFRPSPRWLAVGEVPVAPAKPELLAERFRKAHTLTAVMGSGDQGWAIVDGRTLLIGRVLDGFTLVSVERRSAILESGDARVVLSLPD
jgi:hypothetical protein